MVIAQALAAAHQPANPGNNPTAEAKITQIKINPALREVIQLWQAHPETESAKDREEIEQKLIDRLKHCQAEENGLLSGLAAIALGFIGMDPDRKQVRDLLLGQLQHLPHNEFLAWCIVEGLSQIKHQEIEEAAIKLYRSPTRRLSQRKQRQRIYAVYLLGTVGGRFRETINILNEALDDPNADIRGYAARAVGRLGWLNARERLETRLESNDPEVRETNPWVLRRIAEALGKVGTLESIPVLELYLHHEQLRTRQRVKEAIAEIRRRYEVG